MKTYIIEYKYISQTRNIGWVPKRKEVTEADFNRELMRIAQGVVNGTHCIGAIYPGHN